MISLEVATVVVVVVGLCSSPVFKMYLYRSENNNKYTIVYLK